METLVQFTEYGNVTIDSSKTTVRVSPLTPGTSYQFRLSAITSEGPGEEIGISGETDSPQDDSGKYTYMLVARVLATCIRNCSSFSRVSLLRKRPHISSFLHARLSPIGFVKEGEKVDTVL